MDFWHVILLITTLLGFGGVGVCLYLLKRMDYERAQMEDYLITISAVVNDFTLKIQSLFSQSVHYYDETIYEFIESTRAVKKEIDTVLSEYDDLKEYIMPLPKPEEEEKQALIGIAKNYPITRSFEAPKEQ